MDRLPLPPVDDLHVHLRQGEMMRRVAPLVRQGGVRRCIVMPNTDPPLTTVSRALAYRDELACLAPDVEFLPSLYLTNALDRAAVSAAADAGIVSVKCYPKGVTTGSEGGVENLAAFGPAYRAMQDAGLVLQIHGEMPPVTGSGTTPLNAEARFLPELRRLHEAFPSLRVVLEHVSSAEAVACVCELGATVAATVTAHHLELTADDWAADPHNFCKPVAKTAEDRSAIRQVVAAGHPRFFLGSDSAPHPRSAKEGARAAAGVFTTPLLLAYLAGSFESMGALDRLGDFAGRFGREFYGLPPLDGGTVLERAETVVPAAYGDVVPFRAGETLGWRVLPPGDSLR